MNDNSTRKKITDNIDIVDEISNYLPLEPKGKNYMAVCPFHVDSNPSLTVSPEKRIFKCFVCGTGGDVVSFVSKYKKISQQASMEELALKYKIKITIKEAPKIKPHFELLKDINNFYTTSLLMTEEGKKALTYLEGRNISFDTIKHFGIGFSYSNDFAVYKYLLKKIEKDAPYSELEIDEIKQFSNEKDLFANKITIPIKNNGNIVGFGAREFLTKSPIKYINSRESDFFQKGENLFNFTDAIKYTPDRSIVITEGYFDVITAYQNDVKNCVAVMGVNFNNIHINQMKGKIDNIYLALDSDNAGSNAAYKLGKELIKANFIVKVIRFSQVKDLDEYFQSNTYDDFKKLQSYSDEYKLFQAKYLLTKIDINDLQQKDKYLKEVFSNYANLEEIIKEEIKSYVLANISISNEYIDKLINNLNPTIGSSPQISKKVNLKISENIEIKKDRTLFLNTEDMLILKAIESRDNCLNIDDKMKKEKVELILRNSLFESLKKYYMEQNSFDIINFMDNYPSAAKEINEIYKKEKVKMPEIDELIKKSKKTSWNINILKRR